MNSNKLELRIVKVTAELGRGGYASEDVFSKERIEVLLPSKLRMQGIKLRIDSEVYVETHPYKQTTRGRYIPTFRDATSADNTMTLLQKQRIDLDAKYLARFGKNKFRIGVYDN